MYDVGVDVEEAVQETRAVYCMEGYGPIAGGEMV